MNKFSTIVLLVSLSGMPISSIAAEKLLITGVDTTSTASSYLFVGALIPLPDNSLAHGFVMHLWTDFLKYSYDSGATRINAKANSVAASIAYHGSGSGYWWNVKVGAARGNTRLTPDDLGNNSRGTLTDLKLGVSWERQLSSVLKINGIIDYGTDREAYWARFRLLGKIGEQKYHGPEVIFQGDPTYEIQQFGWAITGIAIQSHSSLVVKAGIRKDGDNTSGYAGVDLVVFY